MTLTFFFFLHYEHLAKAVHTLPMVMVTVGSVLAQKDCTIFSVSSCRFYTWPRTQRIHDPIVQIPDRATWSRGPRVQFNSKWTSTDRDLRWLHLWGEAPLCIVFAVEQQRTCFPQTTLYLVGLLNIYY